MKTKNVEKNLNEAIYIKKEPLYFFYQGNRNELFTIMYNLAIYIKKEPLYFFDQGNINGLFDIKYNLAKYV